MICSTGRRTPAIVAGASEWDNDIRYQPKKEGLPVKRSLISAAVLCFLALFPLRAYAQSPLVGHYFIPEYYSTVEEAVGRLKNIQPMLMGAQDGTLRSVEADRFGIRFFWTVGQTTVIPFDKLSRMRIFHNTAFQGPCPWFVAAKVSEEGEPPYVRTATKEAARELYSIIASLSAAAGNPLDLRGNLGGSSDTPTKEALKNAGLKKQAGVAVNLVEIGGPSEKAGLKVGDVILSINGNAIESYEHFEKKVWPSLDLSAEWFDLEIMRKGKKETVKIRTLPADQLPVPPKSLSFGKVPGAGSDGKEPPKLGFVLRNLTMSEKSALKGRTGAAVLEIKAGGLAEAMKMQPGDIILFCNGKAVPSAEGLSGLLVEGENNFLLLRNGKELTVGVNTVTASY
jgi:hypothetical protein